MSFDNLEKDYPIVSGTVEGLTVLKDVPNTGSIRASLEDYEILPGIRRVPMSKFGGPRSVFYAVDDFRRSKELAKEIAESKSIKPLIVVIDDEGSYILEGSHRYVALHTLGVKELPAMVVVDTETAVDKAAGMYIGASRLKKDIERSDKTKKITVFLGGECQDNDWRKELKKEYGDQIFFLDPYDKNWKPEDNIYDELTGLIKADYVIFYKGGKGSEKEQKFLDNVGDDEYEEFKDLDSLKDYLEEISRPIKKKAFSDYYKVVPDGIEILDIEEVPQKVWNELSRHMKSKGYDYRGGDDAKELAEKRLKGDDGKLTFKEDHAEAFKAALGLTDLHKPQSDAAIVRKAIKHFGYTSNPNVAGYMLQNGKMLDFSGGPSGGTRGSDHREISGVMDMPGTSRGYDAMKKFMQMGNIRLMVTPSRAGFDIEKRPTSAQMSGLEDIIAFGNHKETIIDAAGNSEVFPGGMDGWADAKRFIQRSFRMSRAAADGKPFTLEVKNNKLSATSEQTGKTVKKTVNLENAKGGLAVRVASVLRLAAFKLAFSHLELKSMETVRRKKEAKHGVSYSNSSTQVDLPEDLAKEVIAWGKKNIPDSKLYEEPGDDSLGREDEIHATILYGIQDEGPEKVIELLKDFEPFTARLGLVTAFRDNDKYDVVKIDIEAPELHKMHYLLDDKMQNNNSYPTYQPHVTIAYIKKGMSDAYIGADPFRNREFKVDKITFSSKNGDNISVGLGK